MTNSAELISLDSYAARKSLRLAGPRSKPPKRPWAQPKPVAPKDKPIKTSCFAETTLVETPLGIRLISELFIGDRLLTRTGAAEPIRWIGPARINAHDPVNKLPCRMINIPKGHFDHALPMMDLKMPAGQSLDFPNLPAPIAVCDILDEMGSQTIRPVQSAESRPIHIHLTQDEFIKANGVWVQVLGRSPDPRISFSSRQRAEIAALYPGFVG